MYRHRLDDRCHRPLDVDLLAILQHAEQIWPEQVATIGELQAFLRRIAGFTLTASTIEKIRAD
jgi:hypothetical protein